MSRAAYYVQECPTCGRRLHIRVAYLGRHVACQHCGGEFLATDSSEAQLNCSESGVLRRANELLATSDSLWHRPR